MAKLNLKPLKVCKLCEEQKAKSLIQVNTTGLVNKKPSSGTVCAGYAGKMICGWNTINKV